MPMTPDQRNRAKQNMQDTSNLSWDDVKQQWVNQAQGAIDAINPNVNDIIDPNAPKSTQYATDPAAMAKVRAMMGVTPQSVEEHRINQLKAQQSQAQEAATGQQFMDQMAQPGADEGFETSAQRAARFNKTKTLLGK